ncbi:unnamed protein product [Rotaria magnacalcarata]|uniref:Uncharacterized protein n=1 Tax=Rotaria magnacalcarata TaxID=392030 RepID=A0A814ZXC3_9BILA|nr:unnamed protein product [Rotaria magnacalcarata]CAF3818352.1 unnamed protein product [Rotaria magnacalcarata]
MRIHQSFMQQQQQPPPPPPRLRTTTRIMMILLRRNSKRKLASRVRLGGTREVSHRAVYRVGCWHWSLAGGVSSNDSERRNVDQHQERKQHTQNQVGQADGLGWERVAQMEQQERQRDSTFRHVHIFSLCYRGGSETC